MKRTIRICKKDGTYTDLEITRATKIKGELGMLHLDKIQTGWRLIFTEDIVKDFTEVDRFEIHRED